MKFPGAILSVLGLVISQAFGAAIFQGLGDLPGGTSESHAYSVSADGSVVIGESKSVNGNEAFRWTSADGMVGLGDLPGAGFESAANDVSADGSVVIGYGQGTNGFEAFRWTSAGGMVGLGTLPLPNGSLPTYAQGVSMDGAVVVGVEASNPEAYRWTNGTNMVSLGDIPGGPALSGANATSADGSVVVGFGTTSNFNTEAFRWTSVDGIEALGFLPDGAFPYSEAVDVSADGSVIVGFGTSANGDEAFRWTSTAGLVGLGFLTGDGFLSEARGISADGSVIVGFSQNAAGSQAFRWTSTEGMQSIAALLTAAGINLSGWQLQTAYATSADGNTIVGSGVHNGNPEAWIARFGVPSVPKIRLSGKTKVVTTKKSLALKGTVTGDVTSVTYKLGKKTRRALGSAAWRFKAKLNPGRNVIVISAQGPYANSAPLRVVVIRK